MKAVIIGNGVAGTIAAKTIRELDMETEIEVWAAEKHSYYPRPNLIEFLAGNMSYEKLFPFPENWNSRLRIDIHLGRPVRKILPGSNEIDVEEEGRRSFDVLLLANGSQAFVPPLKGVKEQGVFTLRTLDDALAIIDYLPAHGKVTVLGGGLLGLEIARALKAREAEVEVSEYFDRLLPRQLDERGASLLKSQIEKLGIKVRLGTAAEEILGMGEVEGLRFKGGGKISCRMVIIAAGVRPDTGMAAKAGLGVDRGILVNDAMQTSLPGIYAAGDNAQHRGKVYGIIPAAFDQARIAAYNMAGLEKAYEGTVPSNTLKVMGISLTSIGIVNPEGSGYEEIRKEDGEKGVYKKIVLQDGVIVGAIWMGTKQSVNEINRLILSGKNLERWKELILNDDFDFSIL